LKEGLESDIDTWLQEKGYESTRPVAITFEKGTLAGKPFEILISKRMAEVAPHLLHIQSRLMFPIECPITIIGRGNKCHIRLLSETVSRKHACIICKNGEYLLTDLSSKNGTRVNNKRVSDIRLFDGDKILFGSEAVVVRQ
jgi:hypothetical protein